jgi:AraC-type DNA-binding domain-containing proteins
MRLSIHIDRPDARVRSEATISAAVARSAYPLPGAEVRYWVGQGWQVLEQGYDLPDVYVCSIEVEAMGDTVLPIRCPQHDLYGFYVVAGSVSLTGADEQTVVLRTDAGHYRLSYLPAAAYTCRFATGTHQIFYFVAKDSVLFREPSAELGGSIAPVEALRVRLAVPAVSARLSMAGVVADAIRRFLRYPGNTYLRRYLAIHTLAITLLLQACEALHVQTTEGQVGLVLATRMRAYIDERVIDGQEVDVASVARRFEVSYGYAKLIFHTHIGHPVGGYIRTRKLEQARRMLAAGEQPAQVARYVCWTYGHFNKAFKARYGVAPGSYRASS